MVFLAIVGFLALFALGFMFCFVGACVLFWSLANGDNKDFSWIVPMGIGAVILYGAFSIAPFTVTVGLA